MILCFLCWTKLVFNSCSISSLRHFFCPLIGWWENIWKGKKLYSFFNLWRIFILLVCLFYLFTTKGAISFFIFLFVLFCFVSFIMRFSFWSLWLLTNMKQKKINKAHIFHYLDSVILGNKNIPELCSILESNGSRFQVVKPGSSREEMGRVCGRFRVQVLMGQ